MIKINIWSLIWVTQFIECLISRNSNSKLTKKLFVDPRSKNYLKLLSIKYIETGWISVNVRVMV